MMAAHRAAFFLAHGRWPSPDCLHHCDNPPCVRPDHLFEGDTAVNMADKVAKDRQARGERDGNAKLTEPQVLAIRASTAKLDDIAATYGISRSTVKQIRYGRTWRHLL